MSAMPSVITLPGIDSTGASLVENETNRLQSDTNSKRAAASQAQQTQAGLDINAANTGIRQQEVDVQAAQEARLRQRDIIEQKLAQKQLEMQARITSAKARYQMARDANDEEATRSAGAVIDETTKQLFDVQEQASKLAGLNAILEGVPRGAATAIGNMEEAKLRSDNSFVDAIRNGVTQYRFTDAAGGANARPSTPAEQEAGGGLSTGSSLVGAGVGAATNSPELGMVAGSLLDRGAQSIANTIEGVSDADVARSQKGMQEEARRSGMSADVKAGGFTRSIVNAVAPQLGFRSGEEMGKGSGTLSILLDSMQESAAYRKAGDSQMAQASLDAAKRAAQELQTVYGISDRKLTLLFSGLQAAASGSKADIGRTKAEQIGGQLAGQAAGALRGGVTDVKGEDLKKSLSVFDRMEDVGVLGQTSLGLKSNVILKRSGATKDPGTISLDGERGAVRKITDPDGKSHYELTDADPSIRKILADVIDNIASNGELTDMKLLDGLPQDLVETVVKYASDVNNNLTSEEHLRNYTPGTGPGRRKYGALLDALSHRAADIAIRKDSAQRSLAAARVRHNAGAEGRFLQEEAGAYSDAASAFTQPQR